MNAPCQPHTKDAEAAGRYCVDFLAGKKKWARNADPEYLYWLARWAGHWGNLALTSSGDTGPYTDGQLPST